MDGLPVTIRLLDPPLHEFLPHSEDEMKVSYYYDSITYLYAALTVLLLLLHLFLLTIKQPPSGVYSDTGAPGA